MANFTERLQHAWNAFRGRDRPEPYDRYGGYGIRQDRLRYRRTTDRSMVTSIFNRIAMDVSAVNIRHVRVDENGNLVDTIKSKLNNCLTVEANIDQTGRSFMQDVVMSMFDEGCVAVVPTDTNLNPITGSFDVLTMRTGRVTQWYPKEVRVEVYNENSGRREEVRLPKSMVAIIENPLYAVINEPNSTLQRLIHKLNLLDMVDEQSSSGKLDLIIQLPYVVKSDTRRAQAEQRRKDIETQLAGTKYGIAYTDATEHITQLNRSINNNLMDQIEYLMKTLYNQLGLTEEVFNGTADERSMLNYNNRTIEPILSAIADEYRRKFLSKTARTQGQSIMFFRDPFKLVPVSNLADLADKLTRNAILSSNEFRAILGYKPDDNPQSNALVNKNMPMDETGQTPLLEAPTEEPYDQNAPVDAAAPPLPEQY